MVGFSRNWLVCGDVSLPVLCVQLWFSFTCIVCAVVTVAIDRRKTLGDLKKMLEADVGVTSMDFKV